jgi:hypothetical protein
LGGGGSNCRLKMRGGDVERRAPVATPEGTFYLIGVFAIMV